MDGLLVIVSKATLKKQKYEGMREKKIQLIREGALIQQQGCMI